MSILSVDNISPIGSGTSVTVNSAATLVLTNANSTGVVTATSFVGSGANLTGVLSNIVEDTSPQLGGNLDTNSHEISLDTSHAINFGDSNELRVFYHSGNGQIDFNGTTSLQLKTPANKYFQVVNRDDGNNIIQAQAGGDVQLYHNGTRKFRTTSGGVRTDANLEMLDNHELQLGNNVDLKIFHESSSSDNIIDCATTRPLRIRFGGSNQFEFLSGGGIKMNDGRKMFLGDSSDFEIFHDGLDSFIKDTGTGALKVCSNLFRVNNAANTEAMIKAEENAGVTLSYDASTKFETMSTGARIQGGLLFNSDTAAANTLDDYEEGTWTPDWRGSQALGTTSYGSYNAASYVKIGNQVTVRGHSQITGSSGGQGFWFINNLPFLVGGGDDRRYRSVGSVFIENFNFQDSETDILCFIERNNNDMQLRGNRDNLSGSPNIRVGMDSSFDVMWTITYPTT